MLINNMFTGELQPSTTVGGCIDKNRTRMF